MKNKVSWTQRELGLLAQYFASHDIDPMARGFSPALRSAQEKALPADRWRTTVGLESKTRQDIALAIQNLPKPAGPITVTPPKPVAEQLSTEDLLVELARRVAKMLETPRIVYGANPPVDRGFHPAPKHDPNPPTQARLKKPRILIVGPKGEQQTTLREMFPSLDLEFWTCEDNPGLPVRGTLAEAILWTKFMSHAQQDAIKGSGTPVWFANTMVEIIARLKNHVA